MPYELKIKTPYYFVHLWTFLTVLFLMGRTVTLIVFTEFSPLNKGCFLEGQWAERMFDHSKCLSLNTHHCWHNRPPSVQTGGKTEWERSERGTICIISSKEIRKSWQKNTVWFYSVEFKMLSIIENPFQPQIAFWIPITWVK